MNGGAVNSPPEIFIIKIWQWLFCCCLKNTILSCTFVMKGKHGEYAGHRKEIILVQKKKVSKNSEVLQGYPLLAGSRQKGSDVSLSALFIYLF